MEIVFNYKFILSSGEYEYRSVSYEVPNSRRSLTFTNTLRQYRTSNDLWGTSLKKLGIINSYQNEFTLDEKFSCWARNSENLEVGSGGMDFIIDSRIYEVTVEPDSVFIVLIKIGGLLGLLRIFSFLSAFHEWQFEKKLAKE